MKPLTPADLLDSSASHGFKGVQKVDAQTTAGHGGGKPYQAVKRVGSGSGPGSRWVGPRRMTPAEAAQDYCDYANSAKLLTIDDLRNPQRKTGFNHVNENAPGTKKPFHGQAGALRRASGSMGPAWWGPQRATAEEAAQDSCDYLNSCQRIAPAPSLKSAGHKRPKQPKRRVPSDIAAARGMIRDYEAQQRKGVQGYVYCISDGTAVKIGYSVNPQKRVPELQTGNPRVLTLLGVLKGTEADERRLHRKFRKQNILQEWFHPTDEVLSMFGIKRGAQTGRMSCAGPNFNTMPAAQSGGQPKEATK